MLSICTSSNLTVTSDCGHNLKFTPRGADFHVTEVTQRSHSTCCHGDGYWRRQEVNNRVWSVCPRCCRENWTNKQAKMERRRECESLVSLSPPSLVSLPLWPPDLVPSSRPHFQGQAEVMLHETCWCVCLCVGTKALYSKWRVLLCDVCSLLLMWTAAG